MNTELTLSKRETTEDFVHLLHKHCKTQKDANYLASVAIAAAVSFDKVKADAEPPYPVKTTFINIGGETFRCPCGSNLFSKMSDDTYRCNSCPNEFAGE